MKQLYSLLIGLAATLGGVAFELGAFVLGKSPPVCLVEKETAEAPQGRRWRTTALNGRAQRWRGHPGRTLTISENRSARIPQVGKAWGSR